MAALNCFISATARSRRATTALNALATASTSSPVPRSGRRRCKSSTPMVRAVAARAATGASARPAIHLPTPSTVTRPTGRLQVRSAMRRRRAASRPSSGTPIILTGDGGWADLDKRIAAGMAVRGIPSVGWSSLRVLLDTANARRRCRRSDPYHPARSNSVPVRAAATGPGVCDEGRGPADNSSRRGRLSCVKSAEFCRFIRHVR